MNTPVTYTRTWDWGLLLIAVPGWSGKGVAALEGESKEHGGAAQGMKSRHPGNRR